LPPPPHHWPAGHVVQPPALVRFVLGENVPGAQACAGAVGEPEPLAQKKPAPHGTGAVLASGQAEPAGHVVQSAACE
jgi:hypothetical protein